MKLLDLAIRLRWSTMGERALSHPHEIAEQDDEGLTVLHWACCNNPPLHIIRILLEQDRLHASNPECRGARQKDVNGMTPLLSACACQASLQVISCLIEGVPETVSETDHDGWTALHYICCNARSVGSQYAFHVAKCLLEKDTSSIEMKDKSGHTPLFLLCNVYEDEMERFIRVEEAVRPRFFRFRPSVVDDFWAIASLIARTNPQLDEQSSIMHYIVAIPECPLGLIRVAVTYFADTLRDQDGQGNTPLHLAASKVESSRALLSALVNADPQLAKMRNHDGLLPLAVALKGDCGWTIGHGALLQAHPIAIESCCLNEAFYPFLLERVASPSTVFELLRAKPNLVRRS